MCRFFAAGRFGVDTALVCFGILDSHTLLSSRPRALDVYFSCALTRITLPNQLDLIKEFFLWMWRAATIFLDHVRCFTHGNCLFEILIVVFFNIKVVCLKYC